MNTTHIDIEKLQELVYIGYEKNIVQILYSQDYNKDGCKGIFCQIGDSSFYFAGIKGKKYDNLYQYIRDTSAEENVSDIVDTIYRKSQHDITKEQANYYYNFLYSKIGNIYEAFQLWLEFEDIPINTDGEIEIPWRNFPAGTQRENIWHWFEKTYHVSVAKDLMDIRYDIL